MSLVTPKEISRIIKMDKLGPVGTFTGWLLMKTIRISRLNEIYDKHKDKQEIEFLDAILNEVKIKFEIPEERRDCGVLMQAIGAGHSIISFAYL